jgi:hypothetical protein
MQMLAIARAIAARARAGKSTAGRDQVAASRARRWGLVITAARPRPADGPPAVRRRPAEMHK